VEKQEENVERVEERERERGCQYRSRTRLEVQGVCRLLASASSLVSSAAAAPQRAESTLPTQAP
jgi:hypothetical protein